MVRAKVIVFTEFRHENKEFIPINLVFVKKDLKTINFTNRVYNRTFYNLKDYTDFILTVARNNNFSIDYVSQFGCKFYNIMFRNVAYDGSEYDKFAYQEG